MGYTRPMPPSDQRVDVVVVGAGIVGLATAIALQRRFPGLEVLVLEKEATPCAHQTGHNSGVIHTGVYYAPGSLKAKLAVEGARRMLAFCDAERLPLERCGKLIVATDDEEAARLADLHARGDENGVEGLERVGPEGIAERQPGVSGVEALWVPTAAVTDYGAIGARFAELVGAEGGEVRTSCPVRGARREGDGWIIDTGHGVVRSRYLITCAGLHSDRVARAAGTRPGVRIVPFRGEYLTLSPGLAQGVRRLVYPVPDPRMPFLGVHLTPSVDGSVEAGPNAVLALSREGYTWLTIRWRDLWEAVTFSGVWRLVLRHPGVTASEVWRSLSRGASAKALRKLFPAARAGDLSPGAAGVRAQAMLPDGRLADDFQIAEADGALHVLNAPSPAATASLPIGELLADKAADSFGLG